MRLRLTTLAAAATLSALNALAASALVAESLHAATTAQLAADVAGRIVDRAGQPVRDATVTIPELSRAVSSGPDGRFRFDGIPQGRYTLAVRRLGYVAIARSIVVGEAPLDVSLTLEAGALPIEPVNVTATRMPVAAIASPLATSILTGEQVHPDGGISLAHSVAQLAGVRNVSSGQQVGKPMIRGLFGPRVLVLTDGSRVEDYSWSDEDGPSIDARLAQRIEVIRGPASVLYGSEALGGVVNVIPSELPFSADGSKMRRGAIEAYGQWQRHSLTEVSDDCQPAPGQTSCIKVKDQKAFGLVLNTGTLDILAHHAVGEHLTGTLGVSGMYQLSGTSGPIFLAPGATTTAGGAFSFEQLTFGQISFVTGLRADTRRLASDASAPLALTADSRSWSATNGDVGVVVRPVPELSVVANLGTGWRAPTLFDLYTNGPNVADARYEIGNPTLQSERDHNIDGGLLWASDHVRADVSVFQNSVDRFIHTAPTTQTISGLRVFRHRQTDARLTGAELSGSIDVFDPLTVRASHDFVNGSDRATGAPLPLMPPPCTIIGANLHTTRLAWAQRASIGAEVEINATQARLDPSDIPSKGYTLLNLDFAMERFVRTQPIRFDVDIRNATNTSYKDFLSRYKGSRMVRA